MPLIDLTSDLAWYGTQPPETNAFRNDDAQGFTANVDDKPRARQTRFKGVSGTPLNMVYTHTGIEGLGNLRQLMLSGYERFSLDGATLNVSARKSIINSDGSVDRGLVTAGNAFRLSNQGTATRRAQLGTGTRLPISPLGAEFTYQVPRVSRGGWHADNRYGEIANDSGAREGFLLRTYRDAGPLREAYNRLNLREDAYNTGFLKTAQPFILRGIQREGSSDTQRWGLGLTNQIDIPRGGPVTAAERAAVDVIRLSKFIASPTGIQYLAKQQGFQLMNPNTEGVNGFPSLSAPTKIFSPTNMLASVASSYLGIRVNRHGVLPYGLSRPLPDTPVGTGRYEDIHAARGNFGANIFNRLNLLRQELLDNPVTAPNNVFLRGTLITTISAPTGPKAPLGLGLTPFTRATKRFGETYNTTEGAAGPIYLTTGGVVFQDRITNQFIFTERRQYAPWSVPYINNKYYQRSVSQADPDKDFTRRDFDEDDRSLRNETAFKIDQAQRRNEAPFTFAETTTDPDFKGPSADGVANVLDRYRSISYGQIMERAGRNGSSTNPNFYYSGSSRQPIPRFTEYGIPNTRTAQNAANDPTLVDETNAYDYQPGVADLNRDLIPFKFRPLGINESYTASPDIGSIIFRSFLLGLDDNISPQWQVENDIGYAFAKALLIGIERSINVTFRVPVLSERDRGPVWNKLDAIASYCVYPSRAGNFGFSGRFVAITIGDLYRNHPGYITSLQYTWDTYDSPWILDSGFRVPFYTEVSLAVTLIPKTQYRTGLATFAVNE